jgi:hypothetical protein
MPKDMDLCLSFVSVDRFATARKIWKPGSSAVEQHRHPALKRERVTGHERQHGFDVFGLLDCDGAAGTGIECEPVQPGEGARGDAGWFGFRIAARPWSFSLTLPVV